MKSPCTSTGCYPTASVFGLTSQVQRAAVSVPSNVAEGQARHTTREFVHFISLAEGSLAEVDTLALDAIGELRKMLNALRRRLQDKEKQQ
jgi:four helix bundle protein